MNEERCLECGSKIESVEGRRRKKFCDNKGACRNAWHRKNSPKAKKKINPVETSYILGMVYVKEGGVSHPISSFQDLVDLGLPGDELSKYKGIFQPKETPNKPSADQKTSDIPSMPTRNPNEDAFDFAMRKNEWKKKYQ